MESSYGVPPKIDRNEQTLSGALPASGTSWRPLSGSALNPRGPASQRGYDDFRNPMRGAGFSRMMPRGGPGSNSRPMTVMAIDDQSTGLVLISEILRNVDPTAKIVTFGDPFSALAYASAADIDLVLTDYRMPSLNGIETIRRLRGIAHISAVPIVCLTIDGDREVRYKALEAGASDFLTRPLDPHECAARCRNLLSLRRHQLEHQNYTENLECQIEQVSHEMRVSEMETLLRLARVAEQRDTFTGLHLVRMAKYSALLARACNWTTEQQHIIELAAPLHDVGKIATPDSILQAQRRLSDEEMQIMRSHATVGHAMLDGSPSRYLQMAAAVALGHHEKFDGSGYPGKLAGHQIPPEARIVAIADVYDALTSKRHYKAAWTTDETTDYMRAEGGKHFDPELLELFFSRFDDLERIRIGYSDPDSLIA